MVLRPRNRVWFVDLHVVLRTHQKYEYRGMQGTVLALSYPASLHLGSEGPGSDGLGETAIGDVIAVRHEIRGAI